MSMPSCPVARPIPRGILVSCKGRARQAEKQSPSATGSVIPTAMPAPLVETVQQPERPALKRKRTSTARKTPWLWIASAGSCAWVVFLLAFGLSALGRARSESQQPPAPIQAIAAAPVTLAPAVIDLNTPPAPPLAMEPASSLIDGAPRLPFREVRIDRNEETPPPLKLMPGEEPWPKLKNRIKDALPGQNGIDRKLYQDCGQIGSNILFMKDPPDAFQRARAEKKLVFMIHLSGNLEDKEFT
jgi:hypothetical protein